jgi:hypothetical protein
MSKHVDRLPDVKCLRNAQMLVPKLAFKQNGSWRIRWPKDQPHVVHAKTDQELVVKLAIWLKEIDRVG